MSYVGKPVARKEDRHLLTGRGFYLGDVRLPGMVEAAILRSPVAHARITHLDTSRARRLPGVVEVVTARDLANKVEPFTRPFYKSIPQHVVRETIWWSALTEHRSWPMKKCSVWVSR